MERFEEAQEGNNVLLLCPECGSELDVSRIYYIPQVIKKDAATGELSTEDESFFLSNYTGDFYVECRDCDWSSDDTLEEFIENHPDCVSR